MFLVTVFQFRENARRSSAKWRRSNASFASSRRSRRNETRRLRRRCGGLRWKQSDVLQSALWRTLTRTGGHLDVGEEGRTNHQ